MRIPTTLAIGCLLVSAFGQQNPKPSTVSGRVTTEIPRATVVHLLHLKDADCAKLVAFDTVTEKDRKQLDSCSSDLGERKLDGHMHYEFSVDPGWYAVHVLFVSTTYLRYPKVCKFGDWAVGYFPWRDSTHTYNMMAWQDRAFELKPGKKREVDFQYLDEMSDPRKVNDVECLEMQHDGWMRTSAGKSSFPEQFPSAPSAQPPSTSSPR